jgi:hypothetical protein
MVEGLIISENISLFEEFNINFSDEKNSFEYANSSTAAKELIAMEMPDFLVVMENTAEQVQAVLKDIYEETGVEKIPVICMLPEDQWDHREILWQMGVKDFITLPVSKTELRFQIDNFLSPITDIGIDQQEAGMNGKLEDYNLLDLIQILESNKKTGILNLYRAREEGKIWFYKGSIQKAEYRSFQPMEAILKMISWTEGDFSIIFDDNTYEKIIETDTPEILLKAIQYIDDRNRILDTLPDRSEILLISPETEMGKFSEEKINFLRYFHGGNTIAGYLESFGHDDLFLLDVVSELVEKKVLLTRSDFDSQINEQDLLSEEAGIKNVFKRFFTKKEDYASGSMASPKREEVKELDEELINDPQIRQFKNQFCRENVEMDRILKKVESL